MAIYKNLILSTKSHDRGNILFLILLAVVLFAALSYAVVGSDRGTFKPITDEKAASYAASILGYLTLVENTALRMNARGIPWESMSWHDSEGYSNVGQNNACLGDYTCRVFTANAVGGNTGGGLEVVPIPPEAVDPAIDPGNTSVIKNGQGMFGALIASVKGVGTDAPDGLIYLRGVRPEICEKINVSEGIYPAGSAKLSDDLGNNSTDWVVWEASYSSPWPSLSANAIGNEDSRIAGRRTFCLSRLNSGSHIGYYVYRVVYAK